METGTDMVGVDVFGYKLVSVERYVVVSCRPVRNVQLAKKTRHSPTTRSALRLSRAARSISASFALGSTLVCEDGGVELQSTISPAKDHLLRRHHGCTQP